MNKAELIASCESLAQISEYKRTHFQVWGTNEHQMLQTTLKYLVSEWMEALRNAKNAAKGLGMLAAKEGGKLEISLKDLPDVLGQRTVGMKIQFDPPALLIELVNVTAVLGADGQEASKVVTPAPTEEVKP